MLAEFISLVAFAYLRRELLFAGGARVPAWRMLALTYAANAVSLTLPAGTALSTGYMYRRLRRWGVSMPLASFTLIASGVLSSVTFGLLALSGALLAGAGRSDEITIGATVLAASLIAFAVQRMSRHPQGLTQVAERGLRLANRVLRRDADSGRARFYQLLNELTEIRPRLRVWLAGLLFAGLNWIADLICLGAAVHAIGVHGASLELVVIAYIAGMSVSSFSLLPAGLGTADAAMIFALVHGTVNIASATAAVVLYRLISFAFNAATGWVLWLVTWHTEHRQTNHIPNAVHRAMRSRPRRIGSRRAEQRGRVPALRRLQRLNGGVRVGALGAHGRREGRQ
jgi:uncharacterized protein (TIRG00374 family)